VICQDDMTDKVEVEPFHRYDQKTLILPKSDQYKPNKDYLAQMFEGFKSSIGVN